MTRRLDGFILLFGAALVLSSTAAHGATFDEAMTAQPGEIERTAASREMIRANPSNPLGYYGLAYALFQMGENEKSVAVYDRLEQIPHNTPEYAPSDKGVSLMQLGRYDDARRAFRKALEIKPNFGHAHFNLAIIEIRTKGDPRAALEHIDKADADDFDKTHEYHRVYRGAAYYFMGNYDRALTELNRAIDGTDEGFQPFNYPAQYVEALYDRHYYKALTLKALGRNADAVREMEKVFELREFRRKMPVIKRSSNRPAGNWPCFVDPGRFVRLFESWEPL